MPKMRAIASPLKIGSSRMKVAPSIAARAVSAIGLARAAADCRIASRNGTPSLTLRLAKSTSRIELRTMIPASAIMPIIEVAGKWAPSSACPGRAATQGGGGVEDALRARPPPPAPRRPAGGGPRREHAVERAVDAPGLIAHHVDHR